MSIKTLKQLLGNAGAGIDESHGTDRLYDILKAMLEGNSETISDIQATVATGLLAGIIADGEAKLVSLRVKVGTTGTAGATTIQILLNGASQGELTVDNTDTDGTEKSLALDVDITAGDVLQLNVSAAPTGGANMIASARLQPVAIE